MAPVAMGNTENSLYDWVFTVPIPFSLKLQSILLADRHTR